MKIDITLEQALDRAHPGLRYRIEQSVALLRKAQKLAKFYDPEDGFFLAFSGGKDSQCLFHVAQLAGVAFRAHFSPTSVDPPQLIKFIRRQYPEVVFEKIDKSMYEVAKDMGMVPTMKLRWCCAKFKETAGAGKVTLTGVRHAESVKRAQRKDVEVSGHKFAGTIEDFFGWSEEQIRKKYKTLNRDEFDRDQKEEMRCIKGKDSILINPIIEWSDADVWDFLNKVVRVPHCELYDPPYSRKRIGCILCPMSSYASKMKDIELYPYAKRKWLDVFEYFIVGGYDPGCTYAKRRKSSSIAVGGGATCYHRSPKRLKEMASGLLPCGSTENTRQNCPPQRKGGETKSIHPEDSRGTDTQDGEKPG